ncbi:hypothetical protein [Croceicoccus naphthovorans]|uniref:hypothetical protein n=1 Tax=Croceicoccus naphthovorans TaxID=1348774 RepID=UPI00316ADF8E
MADIIEKVASGWPSSALDELMPWNWTAEPVPVSPFLLTGRHDRDHRPTADQPR